MRRFPTCMATLFATRLLKHILLAPLLLGASAHSAEICRLSFAPADEYVRLKQQELNLVKEWRDALQKLSPELRRADHEMKVAEVALEIKKLEPLYAIPLCSSNSAAITKYLRKMEKRIEDCGTANTPKVAGKSVYGEGEVQFVFDANGKLLESNIVRAADNTVLNQHILKVIEAAAPFGKVPKELSAEKVRGFSYITEFGYFKEMKVLSKNKMRKCKFLQ